MAFPKIETCLICEIVRREEGKHSLLGFHGITPDVRIRVPDYSRPLDFLTFVLLGVRGEGGGTFKLQASVVDPNGKEVWQGNLTDITIAQNPEGKLNLFIQVANAVLALPGVYRFTLLVDDQLHYQTEFSIVL